MRRLSSYITKYGPDAGPKLFHALQSQAAHAGVSARRKQKIERLLNQRYLPLPFLDPIDTNHAAVAPAVLDHK